MLHAASPFVTDPIVRSLRACHCHVAWNCPLRLRESFLPEPVCGRTTSARSARISG